jgi:hypothetical protein
MLVPCRRAKETSMKPVLFNVGRLAGLVGMLLMAVAVLARLMGHFMLGGFATGTLMLAGIGFSVGCCCCGPSPNVFARVIAPLLTPAVPAGRAQPAT